MPLFKRSTHMQKVVVARLLYRCPACGHVSVGDSDSSCPKCPGCGGEMILATATTEDDPVAAKKS